MKKHVIGKRSIDRELNVEQMTRTEKMTSAPVSDDSIFFTIFSKGYGLQEQRRLYKFDKKQETLMIEMLWLCSKSMERWLDMCPVELPNTTRMSIKTTIQPPTTTKGSINPPACNKGVVGWDCELNCMCVPCACRSA